MNLKISARALSFCAHFRAKEDVRSYLTGVCVIPMPGEIGGVLVAATDGKAMGLWLDDKGLADRQVIMRVSPGLLSAASKGVCVRTVGKHLAVVNTETDTDIEGNEIYVQTNEGRTNTDLEAGVEGWEIAGKFPDIARVVPDPADLDGDTGQYLGAIDTKYLALIEKALPKNKYGHPCLIRQRDANSVVLVQFPGVPEAAVVVMPVCDSTGFSECAPWLHRWKTYNKPDQQ